jgi:hypothetical protein
LGVWLWRLLTNDWRETRDRCATLLGALINLITDQKLEVQITHNQTMGEWMDLTSHTLPPLSQKESRKVEWSIEIDGKSRSEPNTYK